jgi:Flp pilus assembly protein TadB
MLCRWCQVRENLLYAFERCAEQDSSGLSQPLRQAIKDLLTRIHGGMPPDEALSYFQTYSTQEHFQDLVFALRFNFRYRGQLPAMLELLEIQQNKLEEAYHHRQVTNASDLRLTLSLLAAVPVLFGLRLTSSVQLQALFLGTTIGRLLLIASLLLYLAAMIWFLQIYKHLKI